MNLYLIRHGDDDENYRGGWSQLPLVEEGIKKCEKLEKYLYENRKELNLDKIISSDLLRTRMTTEIINKRLKLPVEYDERIRENNNGLLAGMENSKAKEEFPNIYFSNLKYNERFPEGESPKEFYMRVKKAFFDIIKENKDKENVVLVTHGGVIAIIYHIVNKLKWTNRVKGVKIAKTSISKLVVKKDEMFFEYQNYTPHLN